MSSSGDRKALVNLLVALFEGDELWRFARHHYGEFMAKYMDPRASRLEQAEGFIEQLDRRGQIDESFFDVLPKQRTEAKHIETVRRQVLGRGRDEDLWRETMKSASPTRGVSFDFGVGDKESRESESDDPIPNRSLPLELGDDEPTEEELWQQRIASLVEEVSFERSAPPPEWLRAAAVLESFDPLTLEPIGGAETAIPKNLLELLAAVSDLLPDGRFSLHLQPRQEALRQLWDDNQFGVALDANPGEESDPTTVLRRGFEQGWIPVEELVADGLLDAAYKVSDWLALFDKQPFDRDQVTVLYERRQRIEPLRRLIGTHFRGRVTERGDLERHLAGEGERHILSLWGLGGVGKSALLGRVLLDLEERHGMSRPWVYLDFDDPAVDPMQPLGMVERIARQLGEFFAGTQLAEGFHATESAAGGDNLAFTLRFDGEPTVDQLLAQIHETLKEVAGGGTPSFGLVFDTFEQAQVRGLRAVELVRQLIDDITHHMPYARCIVSGRAALHAWPDAVPLPLEDLDPESAKQVLMALGVSDRAVRAQVVERVGCNPLSLRLAADAVTTQNLGVEDIESLVLKARQVELQGQLYTRILGHIADGEVRRLAHPGLIVRRVTRGVIEEVLAELCDLDPERIPEIFKRLPQHVTLFEPDLAIPEEGAALRHRQDVREVMLRLMVDDPAWADRLDEIHRRAIQHYQGREDLIGRAEALYHHLMLDDEPEEFDALWHEELAQNLSRCWDEPLPERARAWLGPRIGRLHGDVEAWRDQDWEVVAAREALARFQTGDLEGALELLQGRRERAAGSRLHRIEIQILYALSRWDEAMDRMPVAFASAREAGRLGAVVDLHLLGAGIAAARGDWSTFDSQVDQGLLLASKIGNPVRRLQALLLRVEGEARRHGEPSAASLEALEVAFLDMEEGRLRLDEDLTRRVLYFLGPKSARALRKTAVTFGNRVDQKLITPDAFELEGLLRQVDSTSSGHARLAELAGQVGLSQKRFDLSDLASNAVRFGKLGDALATVLDHAGQDDNVRSQAAAMFRDFDSRKETP